jgi:hypothetical protein
MTAAQPRNVTTALTSAVRHVTAPAVRGVGTRNAFRGVERATLGDDMRFPTSFRWGR